jgi:alpha-glucosidase
VPHAPLVQSTSETPKGPLELRIYPGSDCHGSVYLDDGNTFDYEKGGFLRLALSCQESAGSIRVTTAPAEGTYVPWFSSVAFLVYGVPSAPKEVSIGSGNAAKPAGNYTYDGVKKTVSISAPFERNGQVVTVTY